MLIGGSDRIVCNLAVQPSKLSCLSGGYFILITSQLVIEKFVVVFFAVSVINYPQKCDEL